MILGARGPKAGRPSLDMVDVKLKLPSSWVESIRARGRKVQPFVREAVASKLEV